MKTPMQNQNLLPLIKQSLSQLYGSRLHEVILYGSWARKTATPDSDIDIAVVLDGPVRPGREIDRMIDRITDLNLEHDILLSVYPVSREDYQSLKSPLLMNIRKEGVVL
jgi:predicted nucleotidyltransferase